MTEEGVNFEAKRNMAQYADWLAEYDRTAEEYSRSSREAYEVGDTTTARAHLEAAKTYQARAEVARRFIVDVKYAFEDVADEAIKTGNTWSEPLKETA